MSLMSGSSPAGTPSMVRRPGQLGDLLDPVEVAEGQGERELVDEVLGGGVVGELGGDGLVGNGDADSWHVRIVAEWENDSREEGPL